MLSQDDSTQQSQVSVGSNSSMDNPSMLNEDSNFSFPDENTQQSTQSSDVDPEMRLGETLSVLTLSFWQPAIAG